MNNGFEPALQKYAELIVKMGVNVQPGQSVLVRAPMERLDLVREVTKAAYMAGAKHIDFDWNDDQLTLTRFHYAPQASFEQFPSWVKRKYEDLVDEGIALITIAAPNPKLLQDVAPDKVATDTKTRALALNRFLSATRNGELRRTLVAAPTVAWAREVFPEDSETDGIDKLWEYIFKTTRVDCPDPIETWNEHVEGINRRLALLNAKRLKTLHYTGPGTELSVELPDTHVWIGGGLHDPEGIFHLPNMPTEEVFTAPKRDGVNGTVTSTKPLNYNGNLIENFTLTFAHGKIVDYSAETGGETLAQLVATDEGARYLGEVALVPDDSPISKLNVTFQHTLFDENASCHLAIGMAYPFCIVGGTALTETELQRKGLNTSLVHVDFMMGSAKLNIDGETNSGERLPIFREGNWAF